MSDIQLYIDPECRLSKVPYKVPNNTHYVTLEEYEHLKSELQMEKDNEDRLVRQWQRANNEIHGLNSQVAALIDELNRIKEKSACQTECLDAFDKKLNEAKAEVERLKEGKQS